MADMQPSPTTIPLTVVGQPGGVAQLDGSGFVPDGQIPPGVARDSEVTAAIAGKQDVVVHGSTANTARPAAATVVHWIGSVAPTNVATNDEWTDTVNKLVKRWNGASFDSLGSAAYVLTVAPPTGDAATDSAAIQAAHDALPAAGGEVRLRAGTYVLGTNVLTFSKPITFVGAGGRLTRDGGTASVRAVTTLVYTGTTGDVITVSSAGATLRDFALVNEAGTTPTAGTGINLTAASQCALQRVTVLAFWNCIQTFGNYFTADSIHVYDPVNYGIYLNNGPSTPYRDDADLGISNSVISTSYRAWSGAAGIRWESGGGVRISNCKVNGGGVPNAASSSAQFAVGIDFAVADGVATGDVTIHGNSIANTTVACIRFAQKTGGASSGILVEVSITGNQLNSSSGSGILVVPVNGPNQLRLFNITGNAFANLGGVGIKLDNCTGAILGPNVFEGITGTSIVIGNGSSYSYGCRSLAMVEQSYRTDPAVLMEDWRSLNATITHNNPVRHVYRRGVNVTAVNTWQTQFSIGTYPFKNGGRIKVVLSGYNGATGGVHKEQLRSFFTDASGGTPTVGTIGTDVSVGAGAPQVAIQYVTAANKITLQVQVITGAADPNFFGTCTVEFEGNVTSVAIGQ